MNRLTHSRRDGIQERSRVIACHPKEVLNAELYQARLEIIGYGTRSNRFEKMHMGVG